MYSVGDEAGKVMEGNDVCPNIQLISIYSQQFWSILSNANHYWKLKEQQQQDDKNNSKNYAPIGVVFRNGVIVGNVLDQSNLLITTPIITESTPTPASTTTLTTKHEKTSVCDNKNFDYIHDTINSICDCCSDEEDDSMLDSDSSMSESDDTVDDIIHETIDLTIENHRTSNTVATKTAADFSKGAISIKDTNQSKKNSNKQSKYTEKEYEIIIRKQWENVATITIPFPINVTDLSTTTMKHDDNINRSEMKMPYLEISPLLFPKDTATVLPNSELCDIVKPLITGSPSAITQKCSIIIILIRSGRFAAGVFSKPSTRTTIDNSNNTDNTICEQNEVRMKKQKQGIHNNKSRYQMTKNCCIVHKTSVRYTVRKGQGKAQSTQDNQRRAKSIGSQLRREGEKQLQIDIAQTIINWQQYIREADLVFVSVPKVLQKYFFEATASSNIVNNALPLGTISVETILSSRDTRIRRIPLDLGRPTYEAVCFFHSIITSVAVIANEPDLTTREVENYTVTANASSAIDNEVPSIPLSQFEEHQQELDSNPPMPFLHQAVFDGNIEAIRELVFRIDQNDESENADDQMIRKEIMEQVNMRAGEFLMTPLHLAASSTSPVVTSLYSLEPKQKQMDPTIAAECVQLLLVNLHCNPCIVDIRNRVPYFLAVHDKVRKSFRISRSILGEDYCLWDTHAKVGPSLTIDSIQSKKRKDAEKKRLKRQRDKEMKQQEKNYQEQLIQQEQEQIERIRLEQEAQNIRDGTVPHPNFKTNNITTIPGGGGRVCDFCQIICIGKKKALMFKRLNFSYCSTECVNRHKRELMAKAAMSRLG